MGAPKVSVFTPTNSVRWIREAYQSLLNQSYPNWEWIVLVNSSLGETGSISDSIREMCTDSKGIMDKRVFIHKTKSTDSVGILKYTACSKCAGQIHVELDHDDMLTHNCLEEIVKKYKPGKAQFMFSDWVGVINGSDKIENSTKFEIFSNKFGWHSYQVHLNEIKVMATAMASFPVTARSLCEIFWAPNHVRAWTKEAYELVGGHDVGLVVCDDHDLTCKMYIAGVEFIHLNRPLYIYRVHDSNTVKKKNANIQKTQAEIRDKYLYDLIKAESKVTNQPGLLITADTSNIVVKDKWLDDRFKMFPDYISVCLPDFGRYSRTEAMVTFNSILNRNHNIRHVDLFNCLHYIKDTHLFLTDIIKHITPTGWLTITVPSTEGRAAFDPFDPSIVSYWNYNSFDIMASKYKHLKKLRSWSGFPGEAYKTNLQVYTGADFCLHRKERHPGIPIYDN